MAALPKRMHVEPSASPIHIAFVYSRLPFPMMRGDQLTVAHFLSFLSARGHEVDLYTVATDGEMTAEQSAWLQGACTNVFFYSQSRLAKLWGLLTGLARLLPLQISVFTNRTMARDLRAAIRLGKYDIVYCYYPRTATAVPLRGELPMGTRSFLALQLSQTLNTARMAREESNIFKRLIYRVETRLMSRFEARVWKDFDRTVLIGPADVRAVEEQCLAHDEPLIDNWVYGAHGTDTDKYTAARPDELVEHRVVFSGSMLYPPNIQAVGWFVEQAWPRIVAAVPTAEFIIQGRDPAPEVIALADRPGITVTGTVPDVGEIIRSAHVCVNPVRAAGGMQNKLIEYMASAKAVVASSVANEGIRAPQSTLLIADEGDAFADAVIELLFDVERAIELGRSARAHVLENWTWEKHFLDLEAEFSTALTSADVLAQR